MTGLSSSRGDERFLQLKEPMKTRGMAGELLLVALYFIYLVLLGYFAYILKTFPHALDS